MATKQANSRAQDSVFLLFAPLLHYSAIGSP